LESFLDKNGIYSGADKT